MAEKKSTVKISLDVKNLESTLEQYKKLAQLENKVGSEAEKVIEIFNKLLNGAQSGSKMTRTQLEELITKTSDITKNMQKLANTESEKFQKATYDIQKYTKELEKLHKLDSKMDALGRKENGKYQKGSKSAAIQDRIDNLWETTSKRSAASLGISGNKEKIAAAKNSMSDITDVRRIAGWSPSNASEEKKMQIKVARTLLKIYEEQKEELEKQLKHNDAIISQHDEKIKKATTELNLAKEAQKGGLDNENTDRLKKAVTGTKTTNLELRKSHTEMGLTGSDLGELQDAHQNNINKLTKSLIKNGIVLKLFKQALHESVRAIREVDDAITNMTVVTGESREETNRYIADFGRMAQATSSTITEAANLTTEFVRQGRSVRDAMVMAEETAKAAKIAGISVKDSLTYMTSAINGFNLAAKDAAHVSDVFAKLAAVSATDYNQLAVALSKVSAQANQAGMSMEYTTALLAKGIETTQEAPESIGTALKTVIARFRELSDFGSTLEDGMNVNGVEEALSAVGIALRTETGEFRSLEDVLNELGPKWDDLTGMQRQAIAQAAAGTRQQSRFLAIMQDWDRTMDLVNVSQEAAGASAAQYAKYSEGMTAAITRLENAWQSLVLSLTNNEFITSLVNGATTFINLLSKAFNATGKIAAGVGIAIAGIAAAKVVTLKIQQKQLSAIQKEIQLRKASATASKDKENQNKSLIQQEIDLSKRQLQGAQEQEKSTYKAMLLDNEMATQKANHFWAQQEREAEAEKNRYEKGSKQRKEAEKRLKDIKKKKEEELGTLEKEREDTEKEMKNIDDIYQKQIDSLNQLSVENDKYGSTFTALKSRAVDALDEIKEKFSLLKKDIKGSKGKGLKGFFGTDSGKKLAKGYTAAFLATTVTLVTKAAIDIANMEKDALANLSSISANRYDNTNKISELKKIQQEYTKLNSIVNKTAEDEERMAELEEQMATEYNIIDEDKVAGLTNTISDLSAAVGKNTQDMMVEAFSLAARKGEEIFEKTEFKATITTQLESLNSADSTTAQGRYQSDQYKNLVKNFDTEKFAKEAVQKNETKNNLSKGLAGYGGGVAGASLGAGAGALAALTLGTGGFGTAALMGVGAIGAAFYGITKAVKKATGQAGKEIAEEVAKQTVKISEEFNEFSEKLSSTYNKDVASQLENYNNLINDYSGATLDAIKNANKGFELLNKLKFSKEKLQKMQMLDRKDGDKFLGFSNKEMMSLIQQAGEIGEDAGTAFFTAWEKLADSEIDKGTLASIMSMGMSGGNSEAVNKLLQENGFENDAIDFDTVYSSMKADQAKNEEKAAEKRKEAQEALKAFDGQDFNGYIKTHSEYKGMSYTEVRQKLQNEVDAASQEFDKITDSGKALNDTLLNMISPFSDLLSLSQGVTSLQSSIAKTSEFADRLAAGETTIEDWVMASSQFTDLLSSKEWAEASDAERAELIRAEGSIYDSGKKMQEMVNGFLDRQKTEMENKKKENEEERKVNQAILDKYAGKEYNDLSKDQQDEYDAAKKSLEDIEKNNENLEKNYRATEEATDQMIKMNAILSDTFIENKEKEQKRKAYEEAKETGNLSAYDNYSTLLKDNNVKEEDKAKNYWQDHFVGSKHFQEGDADIMQAMLKGDFSSYKSQIRDNDNVSQERKQFFKDVFTYLDGIQKNVEDSNKEIEQVEKEKQEETLKLQEDAIAKYKEIMQKEYDETKKALEERKKLYEDYFKEIDQDAEKDEYENKRAKLVSSLQALSTAQDGASLNKRKELEKELADLDKDRLKAERDERKSATMDQIAEEEKTAEDIFKEASENNKAIWENFSVLGIETIEQMYKTVANYDGMTKEARDKFDEEWAAKKNSLLSSVGVDVNGVESEGALAYTEARQKEAISGLASQIESTVASGGSSVQFGNFNFDLSDGSLAGMNSEEIAKAIYKIFQDEMKRRGINFSYKQ